jgi:hypothetical protein
MEKAVFFQYLFWHFFDVPKEILRAWKNYLRFYLEYFSVPLLLKTYFSHWHRYYFPYGKWDPARWVESFVGNMMSRVIGMILRTFLIIFGIIAEIFVFICGFVILAGWILLPLILFSGIIIGLELLI